MTSTDLLSAPSGGSPQAPQGAATSGSAAVSEELSSRASWRYSPAIKELQKAEQQSGAATQVISEFWRISALETF